MGYNAIDYAESGTYGTMRCSGSRIDICYGPKGNFDGRGHIVVQDDKIVYIREANEIPACCQIGQVVQPSGLGAMVSGGSLFLK